MMQRVIRMKTIPLSLDGYTELPAGKIANVVTFLERIEPPASAPATAPGLAVVHVERPKTAMYRDLYRRIGEDWLWFSRAVIPDAALARVLARPSTTILTLQRGGRPVGLVELDRSVPGQVEIVTFGVLPEEVGTGAAHVLMEGTLAHAFAAGVRRVWLHTCSFDHPAAVRFYRRHGFRGFKFAIEVSDDPRLAGFLPEDAAPHVPLIRP
jgi:GNAT superfamily N-acetyltransferase